MHLFAGAGGGVLADILLGHQPICAVEINNYCQQDLAQRQKDGVIPWFPIFDDVTRFDGKPWKGLVDVLAGGFPCTDISAARTNNHINGKQRGLDGEKSGLWSEMARIIREVEPGGVFVENSGLLTVRGINRVLWDLAEMGFNAKWGVLSGGHLGAPHERERLWIVASNPDRPQLKGGSLSGGIHQEHSDIGNMGWWQNTPEFHRMDDGMAFGLDRLKAIGNGQIPIVAATAFRMLSR
jgi:DNA (cytosine-5)-methyltransferase 1